MATEPFELGQRVRYVPGHADGDRNHPDCEDGTVSETNAKCVFVKFDRNVKNAGWNTTAKGCDPGDLIHL